MPVPTAFIFLQSPPLITLKILTLAQRPIKKKKKKEEKKKISLDVMHTSKPEQG